MAQDQITAVLFDWDFTLAYTLHPDATFGERLAALFQRYGVQTNVETISAALQTLQKEIEEGTAIGTLYPQKKREIIQNYRLLLERINHADTSYEFAYQLYSGYAELPHYLFEDVLPTLKKLRQCGMQLGILSNHSLSARPTMESLVGSYIAKHHITVSEDIGIHKPNATIFWLAAAKLNESPQNCLYVGDNLQVDAIGAIEKGEYALGLWINRRRLPVPHDLPPRVKHIHSLSETFTYLA